MADFDSIVIGSGAGGLACAVALAQADQRVLVLEAHEVPGGWCHSFRLDGYQFSPGVHYIGELYPDGPLRRIYEGLGVSRDLAFYELNPDGFDHLRIGTTAFDIPKGRDRYEERLRERFPQQAKAIHAYLERVQAIRAELANGTSIRGGPRQALQTVWKLRSTLRWGFASLDHVLTRHGINDPTLRTILAIQAGDHGLPPSKAPFALHASIQGHYFGGAWYPRGGAQALPNAFVRALQRAGGELLLRAPVARILLNGERRATGVRLEDGREFNASTVVSNADPGVTFPRLIGMEQLSPALRRRLLKTRWSISGLSFFGATNLDLPSLGIDSGNYWYSAEPDLEASYPVDLQQSPDTPFPALFLTFTTLKDPSKKAGGNHTFEAFVFVPYAPFRPWAKSRQGNRPAAYVALKERLRRRFLLTLDRVVPGLSQHLLFTNLATPLTNLHYIRGTEGSFYGTEKSRFQIGPFGYGIKTEFKGLYLCGASTLAHGVMGATSSGLAAAQAILKRPYAELLSADGPELRLLSPIENGSLVSE
jgi:phytoene dehydrogenase-like protein